MCYKIYLPVSITNKKHKIKEAQEGHFILSLFQKPSKIIYTLIKNLSWFFI